MFYNKEQWNNLIDAYSIENDPLVNNRSIEDILKSSESDGDDILTPEQQKAINFKGMST